jgi:hypothetical protein
MLTHIVCWKYKPETTEAEIAEHTAKLRALPDVIPNILSFSVGRDILHLERSFDTGLVATYPDRAALDFYTDHPQHQEVATLGKQIAEKTISVDFIDDWTGKVFLGPVPVSSVYSRFKSFFSR